MSETRTKRVIRKDDEGYFYDVEQKARLSSCHKSFVTFNAEDGSLCCKVCWGEVSDELLSSPIVKGEGLL